MNAVKLGDICNFYNGGAWSQNEFTEAGYPVLKVSNCKSNGFEISDVSYIPYDIAQKSKINKLQIDDVIIATVGSHPNLVESAAGRSCVVTTAVVGFYLNQNAVCLRSKDPNVFSQKYLGYLAASAPFKHYIQSRGKGAANQMRIAISAIKDFSFVLPDIEVQKAVGTILSAYDDLIENNQKQIKLLEEAAQRLYKEWLVDLRFPGHENTKIVDGIPEGWKVRCLSEIADVLMGQSPKSEFYNLDRNGLPFHQGVGSYGTRFVKDSTYSTSYTRIAEPGSILFSVRAPVGRLNITKNKIVIGRGLAAINHKTGMQSYLFYLLKERFFKDNIIGNGSIFASISKDELLEQKFIIPINGLVKAFNNIAKSIDGKIAILVDQTTLLIEARDRLLPRLMNGDIEI